MLAETVDGSNALVVVGTGGEASVMEETTKGKLTKLPLGVLKDLEAIAAVAAGQGPPGAVSGSDLMKQVDRPLKQHYEVWLDFRACIDIQYLNRITRVVVIL